MSAPIRLPGYLYLPKYRKAAGTAWKASAVWWWKYSGIRVSTKCRDRKAAEAFVIQQVAKMGRGEQLILKPCLFDELESLVRARWVADSRKGMQQSEPRVSCLRRAFAGWRADAITSDRVTEYANKRRGQGAAVATVNLEIAILGRMFTVAFEAGRIARRPLLHRLRGAAVRQGFIEDGDFERICASMPERYRAPARFLKLTGWREGEALALEWGRVNLPAEEIRLDTSKNGMPRMLAFRDYAPLRDLLTGLAAGRHALSRYVFPGRAGRPINRTTFQHAWRQAAIAAGLPNALAHDLRRSFVRACERAGVPRTVAMSITGHRSEAIYVRYGIVSAADQQAGLQRIGELAPGQAKIVAFEARQRSGGE